MVPAGAAVDGTVDKIVSDNDYKVLTPIRQGNLTVFPVVVSASRDPRDSLTLDERLKWV